MPNSWLQFIHSMKVVEVVKPRHTSTMAAGVKCIFSFFCPLIFTTFSKGGKGRNASRMPSAMMMTAVAVAMFITRRDREAA